MAPPSKLSIATSSLQRLIREEASYHKEAESQQKRIRDLQAQEDQDENAPYLISQENRVLNETIALFPILREQVSQAMLKLEAQLREPEHAPEQELAKAQVQLHYAQAALSKADKS